MKRTLLTMVACCLGAATSLGQVENPDFSIRADFRDAMGESVGNAKFLIKSRFLQVYYGGVSRKDEFRFQIELDDPSLSSQSFAVYLKDYLVDTLSTDSAGFLDQTFRSDFKPDDAPDRPLPAGFPDPLNVGDVVSVYSGATNQLLFSSPLVEEFARGDLDHDLDVDGDDYAQLRGRYGAAGVGPAYGDLTGDDHSDGADVLTLQRNYYGGAHAVVGAAGSVPEPGSCLLAGGIAIGLAWRRRRTR